MIETETLESYIKVTNKFNKPAKKLIESILCDIEDMQKHSLKKDLQLGYYMHPDMVNKMLKLMGYNIMTRHFIKKRLERGEHWRGIYYIRKEELDKNYKEAWRE